MRFLRLSPAGLLHLELIIDGLDVVRREGPAFDALSETTRTRHTTAETAEAALQADIVAARAEGASPAITPPPVAAAFYAERFFPELKARGARPRKKPTALLAEAEARYGQRFPDDLRALLAFADTHDTERAAFGEWRGPGTGFLPLKPGADALATAIDLDRKNYLGTAVLEHLAGLVPIGTAGNGYVYFAHVDPGHPEACEVYLWDHEERELRPFADSIASFAFLAWLYLMDHGDVSLPDDVDLLDALRAGFEPLAAHVSPSWHYRSTMEHAAVECGFEPVTAALFCYVRALWIDQLTRAARPDAAEAKLVFFENLEGWHTRNDWESARKGPRLRVSTPPVYWLFYLTFFTDLTDPNNRESLAAACAELSNSQSSFARDAAAAFAAMQTELAAGGKGALGKLKPIKPLLKAFAAAETGKAKRLRLEAEAAAAAAQRQVDEALGARLLAEAGDDTAAIWAALEAHAARPGVVEVLVAHQAERSPSLRDTLARLDVLADGDRYRDHQSALEWLAWHGDRAVVPLLRVRRLRGPLASFAAVDTPAAPTAPPVPIITAETFHAVRSAPALEALFALCHPDRGAPADAAERARDATALALLDAALARHRGHSGFMIGVRLLRASLAARVGVDLSLDAARAALDFASSDVDQTAALHAVALALLARHAPDEARAVALRRVTFDLAPVRAAARRVLAGAGVRATPRIVDATAAAGLCDEGAEAVCTALADPYTRPLRPLITAAVAAGLGEAIADAAADAIRSRYATFRFGHGYFSSRYGDVCDAVSALLAVPGPVVDAFAHWGVHHPAPVVRSAFEREARARADAHGQAPVSTAPAATLRAVAAPPDALGGTVHGLAVAGPWIVAAGNGRSARFDADGRGAPLPPDVVGGWAYVADAHPDGRRVALGYHACHVVVIDATTGEICARTQVGGVPSGVRTLRWSPDGRHLATGSDDQSLRVLDAETLAELGRHSEPYDINGVDWLDDGTLVCVTDHHLLRLTWSPAGFGAPERTDVGGGAEVRRLGDTLAVGSQKRGLLLLDPATLKTRRTLPLQSVSRVRRSADGAVLWTTCYEGETAGLWRFDLADSNSGGERLLTENLFALDLAPDGGAVAGGRTGRVYRLGPDGRPRGAAGLHHTGSIMRLHLAGPGFVDALDNNGRVLRWDLDAGTPSAPWAQPEPLASAEDFAIGPEGELVVSSMDALSLTPANGAERFRLAVRRSEAVLWRGDVIVAGDGPRLAFVDPRTGERLATVAAGVSSSWLPHLLAIGEDAFIALGYDDPSVARWSAAARDVVTCRAHHVAEDDGRYSRTYGVAVGPRHVFLAHWNHTVHALDPETLESRFLLDVSNSYGVLAVDPQERRLLAATAGLADVYDLDTGALVGRALAPAEIKAAVTVGPGDFVVGLANGELHRITVG